MSGLPTTVFMGTPELALPALRLLARRTDLRLVITQPDRRGGRGKGLLVPPVKREALRLGLRVGQPTAWDADVLGELAVDFLIVQAYGRLLPEAVLAAPRLAPLNLHCSLLPRWRGASPLQAAIRAADQRTGVSVMRMVRRLDAGPVYLSRRFELPATATLCWLHDRMAACSALALGEFLDRWPACSAEPQDEASATCCRKLTTADGELDFAADCRAVERHVRAYEPCPGCWSRTRLGRVHVRAAMAVPEVADLPPGRGRERHGEILIGCGSGALRIDRLQLPGGRTVGPAAFLNGHACPEEWG